MLVHNKCIDNATKVAKRFTGDQDAVIQLAKEAKRRGGITSNEADILWNWAKEYDLVNLYPRSYHPPKFDSYQGGRVKHLKINGMHINILDP